MESNFSFLLVISTLTTGFFWLIDNFFRRKKFGKNKQPSYLLESCNWLKTSASIFPILTLVLIVRSFVYEPFQIPSGSMMPTLMSGDFILVKKYAYGIKDPLFNKTIIRNSSPKRNDIAVFRFPLNPSLNYIKRVIGLPEDRITYNPITKSLIVYPHSRSNHHSSRNILAATYSHLEKSSLSQTLSWNINKNNHIFKPIIPLDKIKKNQVKLAVCSEKINGIKHPILINPNRRDQTEVYFQQRGLPHGSWIIPKGHYFVMGDNRDGSEDSRYWGFVPEKNLVGKAIAIWMSVSKQKGTWFDRLRFERIGLIR